ncbi:MAG: DMT family transporter [Christensenellales bacterium]
MTDKTSTASRASQIKGALLLTLTSLIWGSAFVAQRAGMEHIEPFTFLCIRSFTAGLILFLYLALKARFSKAAIRKTFSKKSLTAGLFCGIALFSGMALQQIGIVSTTAGKAGFLTTLYIVIVPAAGALLGKKPHKIVWLSAAIALLGLYLLTVKDGFSLSSMNIGDILVIACAFCFAAHILLVDRFSNGTNPVAISCLQFLVVGLISLPFVLLTEKPDLLSIKGAWFPLFYTGVLSGALAYTFQIMAQKELSAPVASIIMSLESVFAVLSGWLILGESLILKEAIGCLLMLSAVLLAQMPSFFTKTYIKPNEKTITAG